MRAFSRPPHAPCTSERGEARAADAGMARVDEEHRRGPLPPPSSFIPLLALATSLRRSCQWRLATNGHSAASCSASAHRSYAMPRPLCSQCILPRISHSRRKRPRPRRPSARRRRPHHQVFKVTQYKAGKASTVGGKAVRQQAGWIRRSDKPVFHKKAKTTKRSPCASLAPTARRSA